MKTSCSTRRWLDLFHDLGHHRFRSVHRGRKRQQVNVLRGANHRHRPGLSAWFPTKGLTITLFYLTLGFVILAKGPVRFLLPMTILGMFLLVARRAEASGPASSGEVDAAIPSEVGARFRVVRFMGSWFTLETFSRDGVEHASLERNHPLAGSGKVVVPSGGVSDTERMAAGILFGAQPWPSQFRDGGPLRTVSGLLNCGCCTGVLPLEPLPDPIIA